MKKKNEAGSILIAVLWIMVTFTIFLMSINHQVSAELVFGRWMMDRTWQRSLAKAGVERGLFEMQVDKFKIFDAFNENWSSQDDAFKEIPIGEGDFSVVCNSELGYESEGEGFRYGMCDESGRLNVNTLPEPILKNLFQAVLPDATEKELNGLAQAVIDWRDEDTDELMMGAEGKYYKSLKSPYLPRNGKIESVEELQLIRGITPELYKKIRPYVTVYTDGKINFNTAPVMTLRALGLSEDLAKKVVEFRKGGDLKEGTKDDEIFQQVDGITPALSAAGSFSPEEYAQISNAIALGVVGVKSDVFRIYSIGRLIRGSHHSEELVTCVVRRDGTMLYWKEGRS